LRWLRTFVISPPLSAFCFACFWVQGIVTSWFDKTRLQVVDVAPFWCRLLLKTAGVKIRTQGLDRIDRNQHYVFVSNHLSLSDPPLLIAYLPTRIRFMAKDSLMKMPIIGGFMQRAGHIAVNRDDPRSAVKSLAEAARSVQSKETSILIFAEGTRGSGEELQAFRGGAAHLGIKTGATVIPIGLWGTPDALPKGAFFLRPATIGLVAGDPMPTTGLTAADRNRFTEALQEQVGKLRDRAMQLGTTGS
jgi:1-acyl-sn-glycerol-3-phosphate acyltransferase